MAIFLLTALLLSSLWDFSEWGATAFVQHHLSFSSTRIRVSWRKHHYYIPHFTSTAPGSRIEYDDLLPNPNPVHTAIDVVTLCMDSLQTRSHNEGLEVCFHFSSDYLKAPFSGSLEKFVQHATNPVFASLVESTEWEIISVGPIIPGTNTRGDMQTILMECKSQKEKPRQFLWTIQKERRPPRQNCWLVHECLFVKNAYQLTM